VFHCRHCPEQFRHRSSRNRHETVKHKLTQFTCTKCAKTFKYKSCLTKHNAKCL
jgi:ribosomal protein L31